MICTLQNLGSVAAALVAFLKDKASKLAAMAQYCNRCFSSLPQKTKPVNWRLPPSIVTAALAAFFKNQASKLAATAQICSRCFSSILQRQSQ